MDKFSSMSVSATGGRKKMRNWSGDVVLVKPRFQALRVRHLGVRNPCGLLMNVQDLGTRLVLFFLPMGAREG